MPKIAKAENVAQYFKYLQQFNFDFIEQKLDLRRVPWKTTYHKYQKSFDKLVHIFNKYGLDVFKYIDFFVKVSKKSERNIRDELVSAKSFEEFEVYLAAEEKRKKAFKWFMKSVENIANDCFEMGILTTKDYIRHLIATRKIGSCYLTGKISKYWFAAIPTFKKFADKIDSLSRDELTEVFKMCDIYNSEINEAFQLMKNCKVNPIKVTDEAIFKRRVQSYDCSMSK